MKRTRTKTAFAICVENRAHPASLVRWKVYPTLPDRDAARHRLVRVVDESGEDYLYPARCFKSVNLPLALRRQYRTSVAS
ncbi:MAG TPA: hypothetical protein VGI83_05055 [Gemmatimonadales bacterium]|jgi:hypothetical protein